MTREEVHDLMENELRCVQRGNYCDRDCAKCFLVKEDKELIEAYGYVIKALEQEPILDKIRAEIEEHCGLTKENHCRYCSYCNSVMGVREILEIFDKYKTESEVDNGNDK